MSPLARRPALSPLLLGLLALLASLAPSASRAAAPRSLELDNGARVFLLPGEGDLEVALEIRAGWRAGASGRGLAELAARSLTASTEVHPEPGEAARELAAVASSAFAAVGPDTSRFVIGGVRDLSAVMNLATSFLTVPRFPQLEVAKARAALISELAEESRGPASRRLEARTTLLGDDARRADPFSLCTLEEDELRRWHRDWYRPDRLVVALSGPLPSDDVLLPILKQSIGAWVKPGAAAPTPRSPAAPELPPTRLLLGAGQEGLSVAFPVEPDAGPASLIALLLALPGDTAAVSSLAQTPLGDAAAPGRLLLVDVDGDSPARGLTQLERRLERLAKRPPGAAKLQRSVSSLLEPARDRALSLLESGATGAAAAAAPRDLEAELRALRPGDVKEAARQLLAATWGLVGESASASSAAAWRAAHPDGLEHAAGTPADAAARRRIEEGRALVAAAVDAHGGTAFLALRRLSALGERKQYIGEDSRVLGNFRADVDLETRHVRMEVRPGASRHRSAVIFFDGESTSREMGAGPELGSPLSGWAQGVELAAHPVAALQAAAAPSALVRLEDPAAGGGSQGLRRVAVAGALGHQVLCFEPESGLLSEIRYRARFPGEPAAEVLVQLEDPFPFGSVVLPRRMIRSLPERPEHRNVDEPLQWRFPKAPWDPLLLETAAEDISHATAKAP